jgi:hypothetical protein
MGSMVYYATIVPKTLINTTTDLASRTISYFKNELISADEFQALRQQQDQASAIQQIEATLSKYSYQKCRSWLYTILANHQGNTTQLVNNNSEIFKKIVHIIEQKYKDCENNATPLGWINLQNANNNPQIMGCCINCKAFRMVEFVYHSSNDNDLLDLLYCYENYPHVINYSSCSSSVNSFILQTIFSNSPEVLANLLRVLKNNPHVLNDKTNTLQIRKSYERALQQINQVQGLVNLAVVHNNSKITELLLNFLFTDELITTKKLDIQDLIEPENVNSFQQMTFSSENLYLN